MSKDMLGPIPRALVGINPRHHGVVLDVLQRLGEAGVAPLYHSRIAKALREKSPKEVSRQYHFLKPIPQPALPAFDPQSLTARKDVYLSPEFVEQILSVAEVFQPTSDLSLPSGFDIVEKASDTEIRSEFPKDHVYGPSEFCWQLSGMTEEQPNGSLGRLLSTGYPNIFYVIGKGGVVFVVRVDWSSDNREWNFFCCRLGEYGWHQGGRAFSRN